MTSDPRFAGAAELRADRPRALICRWHDSRSNGLLHSRIDLGFSREAVDDTWSSLMCHLFSSHPEHRDGASNRPLGDPGATTVIARGLLERGLPAKMHAFD